MLEPSHRTRGWTLLRTTVYEQQMMSRMAFSPTDVHADAVRDLKWNSFCNPSQIPVKLLHSYCKNKPPDAEVAGKKWPKLSCYFCFLFFFLGFDQNRKRHTLHSCWTCQMMISELTSACFLELFGFSDTRIKTAPPYCLSQNTHILVFVNSISCCGCCFSTSTDALHILGFDLCVRKWSNNTNI